MIKDKLKFINSIAIGGFHITKDISKIFNISIEDAEKIKNHLISLRQSFLMKQIINLMLQLQKIF